MTTPIDIAKDFLSKHSHLSHMTDGDFTVDRHDSSVDYHVVNMLPDVNEEHVNDDVYHVVTVSKDFVADDGTIIPKFVKMQLNNNNQIENVTESK